MAKKIVPADGEVEKSATAGEGSGEKKLKSSIKYPPYVNAHGSIGKLFARLTKASVPPKFTIDFMETVLELKSSSHRALIPLLKRLGFIDAANVPTDVYKQFRDDTNAGQVMAAQMKLAFADIYKANEYAHNLSKEELISKLRSLTGAAEDDPNINAVVGTFIELKKLADFSSTKKQSAPEEAKVRPHPEMEGRQAKPIHTTLGLSYTINLNLPATTEIEVFNAIFKSLKEHLLDGQ
jgi:hypothetical protein